MAEEDKVFSTKVKHSGVWDFKGIYAVLSSWFSDNGYGLSENSYKENIGAGGAKEIEIEWEASKKVTDYFKYKIKANWQIVGMTSVEVEIDGAKKKMNKGQFEIAYKATITKDYEEKWTSKPIWKFLRALYDKYLIKETKSSYEDKLVDDIQGLVEETKAYLALTGRK